MKAIETVYKGYRFRSRLEARWAVFFDSIGVHYQYECEGYKIPVPGQPDVFYLPDFFIPMAERWEKEIFFEVKPCSRLTLEDQAKVEALAKSGFRVGILTEIPEPYGEHFSGSDFKIFEGFEHDGKPEVSIDESYFFTQCPICGNFGFEYCARAERIGCKCSLSDKSYSIGSVIEDAFAHARGARFERGQNA